jgi:hypothetical protein
VKRSVSQIPCSPEELLLIMTMIILIIPVEDNRQKNIIRGKPKS